MYNQVCCKISFNKNEINLLKKKPNPNDGVQGKNVAFWFWVITLTEALYLGLGIGANAVVSSGASADHSDQLSGLLFSY